MSCSYGYGGKWVAFFVLVCSGVLLGDEPPIVFASRDLGVEPDLASRVTAIERAKTGKLLVREAGGQLRVLVDATTQGAPQGTPMDVADPDVSFDGARIVFAGYSEVDGAWRVFEIQADGSGLRQVTRSDRQVDLARYGEAAQTLTGYDDVDPCYLPDGRVCFSSTRYPGTAPNGRLRATNLYVVNADGSDLHRITSERFGADTPTVELATGRIIYSRWWRSAQIQADPISDPPEPIPPGNPRYTDIVLDESTLVLRGITESSFPGVNSWFLAGIDPDGTDLAMFSGFRLDRELTQAYRPSFLADGRALALFIPKTPYIGYPRGNGVRLLKKGPGTPIAVGGPQSFNEDGGGNIRFLYASATGLSDGRVLVTAAPVPSSTPDYGIYIQESPEAPPVLLHNQAGMAELDALPLVARQVPPVIPDEATDRMADEAPRDVAEAFAQGGSFTFQVENIHFNAPVDVAIANAPPVGKHLVIEFYTGPQRTSPSAGDPPLLIHRVEIPPDGRVEVELPAGVPLFEVLRRPDDSIPLGRDGQVFHVGGFNFGRSGQTASCVGCHSGHSQLVVPDDPSWTNVAPSAIVRTSSPTRSLGSAPEGSFEPVNLVDRRTDLLESEWAARSEDEVRIELFWSTTIQGREIVLHGPAPGNGRFGPRTQRIRALSVATFLEGQQQESLTVSEEVRPDGTRIPLNPVSAFDALTIAIRSRDVTGLYEGRPDVALAEIEVIAQVTGEPRISFLRGDAGCDGRIDISDAIIILISLFVEPEGFCCQAAADTNADGEVNISDPIFSLGFLFVGTQQPTAPFPECGPSPGPVAVCEVGVCLF